MLVEAFIYFGIAAGVAVAWDAAIRLYNRRRSRRVLQWLESAFDGRGRITGIQWTAAGRFHAHLQLPPNAGFRRARVQIDLRSREMPLRWLLSRWRKQPELAMFEAD